MKLIKLIQTILSIPLIGLLQLCYIGFAVVKFNIKYIYKAIYLSQTLWDDYNTIDINFSIIEKDERFIVTVNSLGMYSTTSVKTLREAKAYIALQIVEFRRKLSFD